jgi:hypothetical protein
MSAHASFPPGTPVRHRAGGLGSPIGVVVGREQGSSGSRATYRVSWPDGRTSVVPGADLVAVRTRDRP